MKYGALVMISGVCGCKVHLHFAAILRRNFFVEQKRK